jgi:hypothetical protein
MQSRSKSVSMALNAFMLMSTLIGALSCATTLNAPLDELSYLKVLDTLIADPATRHYAALEVPAARNVSIYEDYVAFHLYDGQPLLNNGIRAEISIDYPFSVGDTVLYEWEMRIPEGFVADGPLNRWWVMGQWHDQPDPNLGETWDSFPSHSPPVAFYLGELDGQRYLSPEYPDHETTLEELIALPAGQWIHMSVEIQWSQADDGYIKIRAGDAAAPVMQSSGRNMLNGYQHYFKLGMYRHRDISTDNTVHLRQISIVNGGTL